MHSVSQQGASEGFFIIFSFKMDLIKRLNAKKLESQQFEILYIPGYFSVSSI